MSTAVLSAPSSRVRPWTVTTVVVLTLLNAVMGIAPGPDGYDGIPAAILVISAVSAVLFAVGAWGVWNLMKWAAILVFVVTAINTLASFGGIFNAPSTYLRVLCAIGTPLGVLTCVLLVLPQTRRVLH